MGKGQQSEQRIPPRVALEYLGVATGKAMLDRAGHEKVYDCLNTLGDVIERLGVLEKELGPEGIRQIFKAIKIREIETAKPKQKIEEAEEIAGAGKTEEERDAFVAAEIERTKEEVTDADVVN